MKIKHDGMKFIAGLLFVLPLIISAQVDTAWVRKYNGPGNTGDFAHGIAVDRLGYVYVTGGSAGSGSGYDYGTIKYNPNGDTAWVRRYNGPANGSDEGDVVIADQSGNVYVTGFSTTGDPNTCATVKYFPNGDTAWVRRYIGPSSYGNEAFAITVDYRGNIYVTCESEGNGTSSDYATIKYYPYGDTAWARRYNGPGNGSDIIRALAVDDSGNVYVTGESYGTNGSADYVTIKYHPNGDTAWVRSYNGPGNNYDCAYDIAVDNSGYVYVTGGCQGFGTSLDYGTVKYDTCGNVVWARMYDGLADGWDCSNALAIDSLGNVYVTGESQGFNGSADYATVKYHPNGDTAWVRRFNGPGNDYDRAYDIVVDSAGGVYVTGGSQGYGTDLDYATVKYYSNGDPAWCMRYNTPANSWDDARAMALDNSGNVYVTGHAGGLGWSPDYATIKYVQTTDIEEGNTPDVKQNAISTTIFSGPLMLPKSKTCRIFDIMGRVVTPEKMRKGVYFIEIDEKIVQKVIKVR